MSSLLAAGCNLASDTITDAPPPGNVVHLQGGSFLTGCATGWDMDHPPHKVSVASFHLQTHEVTVAQFRSFCIATGRVEPQGDGGVPRHENLPARVDFASARSYARWAGGRLPTELEYEWALRGGVDGGTYPWGEGDPPARWGNYADLSFAEALRTGGVPEAHVGDLHIPGYQDGHAGPAPVGSYAPNALGLFDISGNVAEWCEESAMPDCDCGDTLAFLREGTGAAAERLSAGWPAMPTRGGDCTSRLSGLRVVDRQRRSAKSEAGFRCAFP